MNTLKQIIALTGVLTLTGCPNVFNPEVIKPNTEETTIIIPDETEDEQKQEIPELKPIEVISPEIPIYVERNDLISSITLGTYSIGSPFIYSGILQNATKKDITINNVSRNSLEYCLLKGGEVLESFPLKEDLTIILKELGYLEVSHKDNKLKFSTENSQVVYDGRTYTAMYGIKPAFTKAVDNLTFTSAGFYEVQLKVKYSIDGTEYESVFRTGEFKVE